MTTAGSVRRAFAPTVVLLLAAACSAVGDEAETSPFLPPGVVELTPEQVRAAAIAVVPVDVEAIPLPVHVPGTLASPDTAMASIGSIVEGQVGQVMVVAGDRVTRGQPLLRIHSHELTDALRDREEFTSLIAGEPNPSGPSS
jgi:multidrug efflux pump subunit AcrA (membrane-fusion protein)